MTRGKQIAEAEQVKLVSKMHQRGEIIFMYTLLFCNLPVYPMIFCSHAVKLVSWTWKISHKSSRILYFYLLQFSRGSKIYTGENKQTWNYWKEGLLHWNAVAQYPVTWNPSCKWGVGVKRLVVTLYISIDYLRLLRQPWLIYNQLSSDKKVTLNFINGAHQIKLTEHLRWLGEFNLLNWEGFFAIWK